MPGRMPCPARRAQHELWPPSVPRAAADGSLRRGYTLARPFHSRHRRFVLPVLFFPLEPPFGRPRHT